ncbi:MAG: C40 family peptidase [Gaiellaceae bacterium]
MRRPLFVLVLLATIAASQAQAAFAAVHWPSGSSKTGHATRVQKLTRKVVAYARDQLGVPYSWGGASRRTGFDCSGLVYAAYRSIGWKIPRSSWDQLRTGRSVRYARLRPGDLLFTEGGGHVQLVVSKTSAISAPQTGERVRYVPLAQLRPELAGARRLLK